MKKNSLGCTCYLQINTAGCTIFNGIQILIDCCLPAFVDKTVQRGGICLVIDDEQWIAFHKAGGRKNVGPQTKNSEVLLQDNDYRLQKAVFHKEASIVFTAYAETSKVCLYTVQRLLLEHDIIGCQYDKSRETKICSFADDAKHLAGLTRLNIAKQQTNFMTAERKIADMLVSYLFCSMRNGSGQSRVAAVGDRL